MTLHAPLGKMIAHTFLEAVESTLDGMGATRVWISTDALPDLVIMAEVPDP